LAYLSGQAAIAWHVANFYLALMRMERSLACSLAPSTTANLDADVLLLFGFFKLNRLHMVFGVVLIIQNLAISSEQNGNWALFVPTI
jgi:hypothetical protein